MRIGFIGMGRLGLPIAAILSQHHQVTGYDPDPTTAQRLKIGHPWEEGLDEYLNDSIALAPSIDAATHDAEVIVVCVQTPHHPELDGTHPDTGIREPFDLSYVEAAFAEIESDAPVVLMSTVLPGDCRKLADLVPGDLIYSPAFPAMGTTVRDVLDPEFVLSGSKDGDVPPAVIEQLWQPVLWQFKHYHGTWETIELAKVSYNTLVGMKLAASNTIGWLADKTGADGQRVMHILKQADRRIVSTAYMNPGLGDGGACHPRDNIAMSWLAQEHGVYDLFTDLIRQRESHSAWIARIADELAYRHDLGVVILGREYKANSTLTDGSPPRLMANQMGWRIVDDPKEIERHSVVVIGVAHDRFRHLELPAGSVVVDPFGIVESDVTVVRPGRE